MAKCMLLVERHPSLFKQAQQQLSHETQQEILGQETYKNEANDTNTQEQSSEIDFPA